jgi:hypothetical protein
MLSEDDNYSDEFKSIPDNVVDSNYDKTSP